MKTAIVNYDCISAYGPGSGLLWDGLCTGQSALTGSRRPEWAHLETGAVGLVPGLAAEPANSLFMAMVSRLAARSELAVPSDALLLVATTVGEVDLLEKAVRDGTGDAAASRLSTLPAKVAASFGLERSGRLVSSACASAAMALAQADALIRSGRESCILLVAADAVTEFVLAGFSSLMALDPLRARPFDRDRAGLSVGEGAAAMLMMDSHRAAREGRPAKAFVAGAGLTCDANHMTGPSRDGAALARAMKTALATARHGLPALVAAHGTGTLYNDEMELKALKASLSIPVPTFSIKGAIGHTMGSAGLFQAIAACEALACQSVPPTVGLQVACQGARGWVADSAVPIGSGGALIVNAGFGGINAAILLETEA